MMSLAGTMWIHLLHAGRAKITRVNPPKITRPNPRRNWVYSLKSKLRVHLGQRAGSSFDQQPNEWANF